MEVAPFSPVATDGCRTKAFVHFRAGQVEGELAAKYFVETLMEMDPAKLDDRAAVTEAIKGIKGKTSDLMCGPYYVGEADRHMPNHAGIIVAVKGGKFEKVRDCFEYEGPYFAPLIEAEQAMGQK